MVKSRSIAALSLAMLVVFSSTSFMVGLHICSGEVRNIALFTKAEGCEKEKQLPPCHRHKTPACCQDETIVHDSDEFQAVSQVELSPLSAIDIAQPTLILSAITTSFSVEREQFYAHDPPLLSCDLTVALHSFLI